MRDNILIIGGNSQYHELFREMGFRAMGMVAESRRQLLTNPEEISLVVFTGGEDVHPSFYGGEDKRGICMTNFKRDIFEKNIFDYCRKYNVKMTGICRGFQFLNVMAGGFMYQHIENHGLFGTHNTYLPHISSSMETTSTHHQLVGPPLDAVYIAWAMPKRSNVYIGPNGTKVDPPEHEVESAIFPSMNAMGAQYHPEMMAKNTLCRVYYMSLVRDFMSMSMDEFTKGYAPGGSKANVRTQSGN